MESGYQRVLYTRIEGGFTTLKDKLYAILARLSGVILPLMTQIIPQTVEACPKDHFTT
jgi:hypothetical protein